MVELGIQSLAGGRLQVTVLKGWCWCFIHHDLGYGTETSLSKLMDNLQFGRIVNTWERRVAFQRDLDKL